MGPHLMKRPPKFVQGFIDRHGKPRFYFRRPGFPRMPLPGLPWSPDTVSRPLKKAPVNKGRNRPQYSVVLNSAVSGKFHFFARYLKVSPA